MSKIKELAIEGQTKVCPKCRTTKLLIDYNKGNGKFDRRSICRECEHIMQNTSEKRIRRRTLELLRRQDPKYVLHRNEMDKKRKHSNVKTLKKSLLASAKNRAQKKNLDFNITIDDFEIPDMCPLLNIKLSVNTDIAKDNSYSLDRINSTKGYIKGNVWVISRRANALKGNASLEELEFLVSNLKKYKGDHWIH